MGDVCVCGVYHVERMTALTFAVRRWCYIERTAPASTEAKTTRQNSMSVDKVSTNRMHRTVSTGGEASSIWKARPPLNAERSSYCYEV